MEQGASEPLHKEVNRIPFWLAFFFYNKSEGLQKFNSQINVWLTFKD